MPEPILETRNLTFEYPNKTVALNDVSLTIPEGKKTVLVGSNGSGKSTLFLHFNGILRPKSGEVRYASKELGYSAKSLAGLRSNISVVLQNPDDQIFSTTVEEDVAFGPMNLSLPREEVERRVDDALHLVGLEGMRERSTQQLSFGERKRVALAGALSMKPKVLIMDEPTAGLDSRMVHELLELADELNQSGLTVIMSTHDVEIAYSWADEMRVLHQGRLEFSGPPEDFFGDDAKLHEIGLVPPTLFEMNQYLVRTKGVAEAPFPRTSAEMALKAFGGRGGPMGSAIIVPIKLDSKHDEMLATIRAVRSERASRGVYGTRARRLARESEARIDYWFNAFDNSILGACEGRDFVLYADDRMLPLIEMKLSRLERDFGLRIARKCV
ncbi:MAG: energy-coupling factor ABC transporter ATP-binding protein [Methanomassiliicoccales archaeon]|nr:energy-coupling factor ABC transporter ATP-binding protein [Methanomassiliicoccales archaeon]